MLAGQVPWRTLYSTEFRIDPIATNYKVAVSWRARQPSELAEGPIVIDLIEVRPGPKRLTTSTVVDVPVEVNCIGLHRLPTLGGSNSTSGQIHFLTAGVNGGQFDHLYVWYLDPESKRPKQVLDVLMGDDSRLDYGIVVENSFARYANPDELPKGVKDGPTNIQRTWRLDRRSLKFVAGRWRRG